MQIETSNVAWQDIVRSLAHRAERGVERRRRPRDGVPVIAPYRGIGRAGELIVRGRVLLERRITRAREGEPMWRNVLNAYRRFASAEVPGARVRASFRDAVVETIADDEGHFQVRLESALVDPATLWLEVGLQLAGGDAAHTAHVLVPPADARYGIISDIDDTVVQTGATSFKQMIRSVMLQNAATRLPFEGVDDLYRALHAERNPLFYVSSGPWNLYDLIHDFLDLNGIPPGPIFLQVIQANPGRVKLAIIRDVTPSPRDRGVGSIAEQARAAGAEMLYVEHSAAALERVRRLELA